MKTINSNDIGGGGGIGIDSGGDDIGGGDIGGSGISGDGIFGGGIDCCDDDDDNDDDDTDDHRHLVGCLEELCICCAKTA